MATPAAAGTTTTAWATATATTTKAGDDGRLWAIVLAALSFTTAVPLLAVRYLPFTDLPEHVAAIATVARMLPGGGGAPEYVLSLGQSQYLLYDLVGALLTRLTSDAVLANRIVLFVAAVAWPYAFRALLRAIGRDERLAIFSCTVFWNRALTIGFLPFVASVPLAVFALAKLVEQLALPTKRRSGLLALLSLLVFYAHVSSYVLFVFVGGVTSIARVAGERRWRLLLSTLGPFLPSIVAAIAWWSAGSLDAHQGERSHIGSLPVGVALDAAPIWAFDIWRSHTDEIWSGLWWIAFGAVVVAGLRKKPQRADMIAGLYATIPLLCTTLMYFFTPFHVGVAGYLDVRLAPLLALFALLILRPSTGRAGRVQLALAAVAALGTAATATFEMSRVEREMLGNIDSLLGRMRPRTRVAMLNFDQRSSRTYFWPYIFVGSYHRLKEGTVASYSFSEMAHWPVHYAPGTAPPPHHALWNYHPCEFRYRADGDYYDYVLIQGKRDPFADDHPGPEFRAIAQAGAFTLFERGQAEMAADELDRGPCRMVGPPPAPPSPAP